MEQYEHIKNMLSLASKSCVFCELHNKKLNKKLLFVYLKKAKNEILVFDDEFGIQEIARISYAINSSGVYVSDFIVEEEYQQNGIGKLLFNLAIAHGDKNGSTLIYGYASPINGIKGVSNEADSLSYKKEQMALIEIYSKLGCSFNEQDDENDFKFIKTWEKGSCVIEDKNIKAFIDKIVFVQKEEYNDKA